MASVQEASVRRACLTRLPTDDIKTIATGLIDYDRELVEKTGASLTDSACRAAGLRCDRIQGISDDVTDRCCLRTTNTKGSDANPAAEEMMSKIVPLEELVKRVEDHRRAGDRIVFTNGCFDILHAGHVRYLTAAKQEGDILVVGLNADASVKSIKDPNRPISPQDQRAEVVAGLECVDYVTIFDEPEPLLIIQAVRPDVLIKGSDWPEENIIGGDFVKQSGGRVVRIPIVEEVSTSAIIQRILKLYQKG